MAKSSRPEDPVTEKLGPVPTGGGAAVRLLVVEGETRGAQFVFDDPSICLGSRDSNEIRITGRGVSRVHARIDRDGDRHRLTDLDSTNGTRLNGTPIREAFLSPGDLIEIGDTRIRFDPRPEVLAIPPSESDRFGPLFGISLPMRQLFGILDRAARSDATVLIEGESGTGKELVARALHEASPRREAAFRVFDCSAVSPQLIESELFGHEAGAFTGAQGERQGLFESAAGGTVFLDEIGELPADLQPKLLRVLEAREIRPVGANAPRPIDVRILAATHRDLSHMVNEGSFRRDLYFRLAVVPVRVPALRERREDIAGLATTLLETAGGSAPARSITPEAVQILENLTWSGNVRELRNVLERSAALSTNPILDAADLMVHPGPGPSTGTALDLSDKTLAEIERLAIAQMMERCQGNKSQVASRLGIDRSTLYAKLKKYGLAG